MKRIHIPADVKHRYVVQSPSNGRGFRITKFVGADYSGTVNHPSLAAINAQFKAGVISKAQARTEIDQLVETIYRADGVKLERVVHNRGNQVHLSAFLEARYAGVEQDLISPENSKAYFRRAVEALGELSIAAATAEEMKRAINERYPDNRQQRVATSLNSILKWLGRSERVPRRKKRRAPVRHLPLAEAEKAINRILIYEESADGMPVEKVEAAFKTMCRMALYTGLRIGELLALEHKDRAAAFINVSWQVTRDEAKREPKNGKARRVAVFPEALALYDQWVREKRYITTDLRKRAAPIFKSACRRAWPGKKEWHLCFHDLRHSYAIACLEIGMPIERVAKNLGNAVQVTEEHYTGHFHTDVTVEQDSALLGSRRKLKLVDGKGEE